MTKPSYLAQHTIETIMSFGSAKDGCDDSWKHKPDGYHRLKAIRHLITAEMIAQGHIPDDGDLHEENALTRTAMEIANRKPIVSRVVFPGAVD